MQFTEIEHADGFCPAPPVSKLGIAGVVMGLGGVLLCCCLPFVGCLLCLPLVVAGALVSALGLMGAVASGRVWWGLPAIGVLINLCAFGVAYALLDLLSSSLSPIGFD